MHHVRRVVLLPHERTGRLPVPLLGVQLRPARELQRPGVPLLLEPGHPLHAPAPLGRPAVRVPAGTGSDPEPGALDGSHPPRRALSREAVVTPAALQGARSHLPRSRALPHQDGRVARCRRRLHRLRRRAVQSVRLPAAGLRDIGFSCKTCVQGGGCPEGCTTTGEWFCCLTSGRVGCRFRCSECECAGCGSGSCHCFTNLPIPCTPRLHSGDQPCACPPDTPPIPALGV